MPKPTKKQAEEAIQLLLEYIVPSGTDLSSLKDTPTRVIQSYEELFSGYRDKLDLVLSKRFSNISEYHETVLLKSIHFTSICEHHMLPFSCVADIAYIPHKEVLGISKIARLIEIFAKRLQIQERMTAEIACTLQEYLRPQGVALRILGSHTCMTHRGIKKKDSIMESIHFTGIYKSNKIKRDEFLTSIRT